MKEKENNRGVLWWRDGGLAGQWRAVGGLDGGRRRNRPNTVEKLESEQGS